VQENQTSMEEKLGITLEKQHLLCRL